MKFKTKLGRLTRYALSCGYVERKGNQVLSMEHGVIRVFNGERYIYGGNLTGARKLFDSFS